MNTTHESIQGLNMTSNERGFRVVLSLGIVFAILLGHVTAAGAIFGLSMVTIYLVMTAISGIDLAYDLAQVIWHRTKGVTCPVAS
jgi:hypothetical protein